MVKIKEFSEEEAESTDDETSEEEDNDPPEPPDPPDPSLASITFSVPESSAPEGPAADQSSETRGSGVKSPIYHFGLCRKYVWYLLRKYGHCVELNRSLQAAHGHILAEGLRMWAAEVQQRSGPPNERGNPQFTYSISAPDTLDRNMEDNSSTESTDSVFVSITNISVTESSSQTAEELSDKNEGNNTECDESTKEKSNIVSEKAYLEITAAGAKAGLLSSPELSDYELSDVSDSLAPPDYESLQAELIREHTAPSGLKECPWAKDVGRDSGMDDADSELNESAAGNEPSEASDDGEAAALPASSVVKDCWEEWIDDNRLFNLPSDASASASTEVSARPSSPPSPTTERRRTKLENRQRVSTAQPVTRFIFVPTEKIGRIVGKGGRRIRDIEKETGAKIKVENKKSSKPVTQITLTGTEQAITKADEEICVIIRNFKPPRSGEPTTASVSSVEELELKRLLLGIKNQVLDGEKRCRKPAG